MLDPTAVEAGEEWSYIVGLITARIRVAPLEFQEAQQVRPSLSFPYRTHALSCLAETAYATSGSGIFNARSEYALTQ